MRRFLSEERKFSKMVIILIAIASILSISITCLILKEVITKHDEEIIKVIASDVQDDIRNELLKNVAIAQSMANDLFLHENLKTENSRTEAEQTALIKKIFITDERESQVQQRIFGIGELKKLLAGNRINQKIRFRERSARCLVQQRS